MSELNKRMHLQHSWELAHVCWALRSLLDQLAVCAVLCFPWSDLFLTVQEVTQCFTEPVLCVLVPSWRMGVCLGEKSRRSAEGRREPAISDMRMHWGLCTDRNSFIPWVVNVGFGGVGAGGGLLHLCDRTWAVRCWEGEWVPRPLAQRGSQWAGQSSQGS